MFTPDPKAFAEICYSMPDGKIWRAVVFKHADGWELRFGRTTGDAGTFLPAGTFQNAKALVKFIKSKVVDRVGDVKPIYDTLHKLKNRSAQNVVPACYVPPFGNAADGVELTGGGLPECESCPYRSTCLGESSAQPQIIPEEQCEEPEELFRHRLAQKMKDRYGDEPKKIEKAAAKQAFVPGTRLNEWTDRVIYELGNYK